MRIEAQLEQTCLLATDAHRPISPVTLREREDRNHALIFDYCLYGCISFHPFGQQKAPVDGGPVKGSAKLVVKDPLVECAIPLERTTRS